MHPASRARRAYVGGSPVIGLPFMRCVLRACRFRRRARQCDAEAVTAAPDLRGWLMSLAAFARRAADRHVGVVFVIC